jgi:cytidylate kinase
MTRPFIVAIDGPSGSGKSTAARQLAQRLGVPYVDTGAMYRAIGLLAKEAGITLPIEDPSAVARLADEAELELVPDLAGTRVFVSGREVTREIRQPEISLYASAVSAIPDVRRRLVAEQQRLGRERGAVMEGRDIGTKVFPATPHKFFLTAASRVRAERRARELADRGTPQPVEEVLAEIETRDVADSTRADSPLTLADGYAVIDTTDLGVPEVVAEMERRIRSAG